MARLGSADMTAFARMLSEEAGPTPPTTPPYAPYNSEYDETQTHLMHMTFWPAMGATIIGFWVAVFVERWRIEKRRREMERHGRMPPPRGGHDEPAPARNHDGNKTSLGDPSRSTGKEISWGHSGKSSEPPNGRP